MKTALSVQWVSRSPPKLVPGVVRILDQTRLPQETVFIDTTSLKAVWLAIRRLQVRGAPAIGVAAAMGVAAHVQKTGARTGRAALAAAIRAADYLATARPTAVNLFWALDRMKRAARGAASLPIDRFKELLAAEAVAIRDEDAAMCRAIGRRALPLLKGVKNVLTHCNAGSLATSEFGTALAPVYLAHERGRRIGVYVDETRPLLQGARLTAWELARAGIDVTLICDSVAAVVMREERVGAVLVGADRIAANGDTANKIGTYSVAISAKAHGVPFYVLAPTSTFDMNCPTGGSIPIEQREPDEVTCFAGRRIAPEGTGVYSPAFDVTPARFIAAIVCEKGIARPDYRKSLRRLAT